MIRDSIRVIAYGTSGSRDTLGTATVNRQGAKTPRLLVATSTACGTGSAIDSLASWRLGGSTDPSRMDSGGPRAATLSNAITLPWVLFLLDTIPPSRYLPYRMVWGEASWQPSCRTNPRHGC